MATREQSQIITTIGTHPATAISAVKDAVQGGTANYLTALGSTLSTVDAFVGAVKFLELQTNNKQ